MLGNDREGVSLNKYLEWDVKVYGFVLFWKEAVIKIKIASFKELRHVRGVPHLEHLGVTKFSTRATSPG